MINENNNALEIEIFLSLFWPFQPFPAMVILTVHAQSDWCVVASVFIYVYYVIFTERSGHDKDSSLLWTLNSQKYEALKGWTFYNPVFILKYWQKVNDETTF